MGKHGPCYHCGVTSTPLWRNGPPEKPVLCNACGSRWRTKGTLANYTPLHARSDLVDPEDYRTTKLKTSPLKSKEPKFLKRKDYDIIMDTEGDVPCSDLIFKRFVDEDTSNRSSSGSAISYAESCTNFGGTDGGEWTAHIFILGSIPRKSCDQSAESSAQSTMWESLVPSRKRTYINRQKPSSVEKLTKDLYSILHEQQMHSSFLSGSLDEDLLYESGTPMDSFEMGQGGVLIKHLTSDSRDEESEASSLPVYNNVQTRKVVYSGSRFFSVDSPSKGPIFTAGNIKNKKHVEQGMQETRRDNISDENIFILQSSGSPLRFIDLRDVVNFEEFTGLLTCEEQHNLIKYLPSVDVVELSKSLKCVFESSHFWETLLAFQQLLVEGIFDLSSFRLSNEQCRILKQLALVSLVKFKWVVYYQQVKKSVTGGRGIAEFSNGIFCKTLFRRCHDGEKWSITEGCLTVKSPDLLMKGEHVNTSSGFQHDICDQSLRASYDYESSCFSPSSLFTFQPDRSSCMLDSLNFSGESIEHDLLLEVPSNNYFPHAELLNCNRRKLNSSEDHVADVDETLTSLPSMTFSENKIKSSFLQHSHLAF